MLLSKIRFVYVLTLHSHHSLTMCSHFASIGAWIMIASLAIGPLFQQTVKYTLEPAFAMNLIAETVAAYTFDGKAQGTGGEVSTACMELFLCSSCSNG
jgi:hypothetical protein